MALCRIDHKQFTHNHALHSHGGVVFPEEKYVTLFCKNYDAMYRERRVTAVKWELHPFFISLPGDWGENDTLTNLGGRAIRGNKNDANAKTPGVIDKPEERTFQMFRICLVQQRSFRLLRFPAILLILSFLGTASDASTLDPYGSSVGAKDSQSKLNPGPTVRYSEWIPRVVNTNRTDTVVLRVVVDGAPTKVDLVLSSDGTVKPFNKTAQGVYESTLPAALVLSGYQEGDNQNFVGYLEIWNGATLAFKGNMFISVRDGTVPDVTVESPNATCQTSAHVVNLRYDNCVDVSPEDICPSFYALFSDVYDFLMLVYPADQFANRFYQGVSNKTSGLGDPLSDDAHKYGSAGRLQGIVHYPLMDYFDLGEHAAIHEIGHRWCVYLSNTCFVPSSPHWPLSDLAYGIMGISLSNGKEGGDFPYALVSQGNGSYRLDSIEPATEYNDLELYLMGLIPKEQVGAHFVFHNQNQNVDTGAILQGPVDAVTIASIISANGARQPDYQSSQKVFRLATIVLSHDGLLDSDEMAFFDHRAARGEAVTQLQYASGFDSGTTKPFYLATGGRARLFTAIKDVPSCSTPNVTVPDTTGEPETAAWQTITEAYLAEGTATSESSSSVPSGNVIRTNPPGMSSAPCGSTVDMVISSGPESTGGCFGGATGKASSGLPCCNGGFGDLLLLVSMASVLLASSTRTLRAEFRRQLVVASMRKSCQERT